MDDNTPLHHEWAGEAVHKRWSGGEGERGSVYRWVSGFSRVMRNADSKSARVRPSECGCALCNTR
jgi:hypothetical protein